MPSVIQTTPTLGASIGAVVNTLNPIKQAALGTVLKAADGHDYVYAQATGAIPTSTVVVLTEPAMTVAAGAGAWTYTGTATLASGDRAWIKKTAI